MKLFVKNGPLADNPSLARNSECFAFSREVIYISSSLANAEGAGGREMPRAPAPS